MEKPFYWSTPEGATVAAVHKYPKSVQLTTVWPIEASYASFFLCCIRYRCSYYCIRDGFFFAVFKKCRRQFVQNVNATTIRSPRR